MAFAAIPLFDGDMFDSAHRLAGSAEARREPGLGHARAGERWQQMLALGWQGVLVPEDLGGVGAGLAELAAIVDGVARHGLAVPLIERCAVAPVVLTEAARLGVPLADLLSDLSLGEASVAPVLGQPGPALGADGILHGQLSGVDLSEPASHLLFLARQVQDDQPCWVLLPWSEALSAQHHVGVDAAQCSDLRLDGVQVSAGARLLHGPAAAKAALLGEQAGRLMASVVAVGAAASMIEQTIDYLNTRQQFGVALSTFQALRHRLVEMYVAYENLHGLVRRQVLHAQDQGLHSAERETVVIRRYAAQVSRQVAESAIQLHGGMGMSWEMPVARLAMHAMAVGLQYGHPAQTLDWLSARSLADVA
ncbi:MAG: hypothetical protein RIQ97_2180 [Pseudomonadota bacterium]|jgi:alkylation response protein AidB-like acyl-CoA dehydrogenase